MFARRKYGNKVLLKIGLLGDPKNSKDEKAKKKKDLKKLKTEECLRMKSKMMV